MNPSKYKSLPFLQANGIFFIFCVDAGFEVATKGCCGTGKLEVTYLCNSFDDPLTCKNDTKYVFWDSYHPTEKAYDVLITIVFNSTVQKLLR